MTRDEIIAFLAHRQETWGRRDAIGLASDHAENGVIFSPIFGIVRGREEIVKSYQNLFKIFSDWDYNGEDLIVDGDRAVQVFKVQATHTSEIFGLGATNRRFEIRGALLLDFDNGKIARERRLYDFTSLLLQLGVLKARPGV